MKNTAATAHTQPTCGASGRSFSTQCRNHFLSHWSFNPAAPKGTAWIFPCTVAPSATSTSPPTATTSLPIVAPCPTLTLPSTATAASPTSPSMSMSPPITTTDSRTSPRIFADPPTTTTASAESPSFSSTSRPKTTTALRLAPPLCLNFLGNSASSVVVGAFETASVASAASGSAETAPVWACALRAVVAVALLVSWAVIETAPNRPQPAVRTAPALHAQFCARRAHSRRTSVTTSRIGFRVFIFEFI